jgi:cysteine-rich repeat protein
VSTTTSSTIPVCGDGAVQGTEQCDDGALNGPLGCCAADCTRKPADASCGDAQPLGECDQGDRCDAQGVCQKRHLAQGTPCTDDGMVCTDDVCDASLGTCTHPPRPEGTPCGGPGATPCDLADFCDGVGATCPAGSGTGQACTSDVDPAADDPSSIDVTCEARTTGGRRLESSCDAAGYKAVALAARSAAAARAVALCKLPTIPDVSATKDGPPVTRKLKKQPLSPAGNDARTTVRLKLNKRGKKALKKDGCLTLAVRMVVRQGDAEHQVRRLITLRRR